MDLQKELEKKKKDKAQIIRVQAAQLKIVTDEFDAEIDALKQQIADDEVTYSRGDQFSTKNNGITNRILIVISDEMSLIDMVDGMVMKGPVKIENNRRITKYEFSILTHGYPYTRTYDARKQCKC
jgi:hypothetical protein